MNACGPDKYHQVEPQHPQFEVLVRQIANARRIYIFFHDYRMFAG